MTDDLLYFQSVPVTLVKIYFVICFIETPSHLHLLKRNLKAEGLIVVRIQSVLLHCCLLLLQPLSVLQQVNLHVGI